MLLKELCALNSKYDFSSGVKDEGYHLEDTDVYRDVVDNDIQDIEDTTDAEQRIYWAQESEKRAVKR